MTVVDFGLLLLRVVLVDDGARLQKFFGGGRIKGTAGWFESIGMKPGTLHARVAASTEMAAGIGLGRAPDAGHRRGFVALMLVAAWTVHRKNGFFIVKEGWSTT